MQPSWVNEQTADLYQQGRRSAAAVCATNLQGGRRSSSGVSAATIASRLFRPLVLPLSLLGIWLFPAASTSFSADPIVASGCSVSNVGYLSDLAKEYQRRTGVDVFVRGGGTVMGIEDLREGKVDFAASCRPREQGDPADIEFIQVAWDALVFIVHPSNPVGKITLNSVRQIYGGKIRTWRELGGGSGSIKIFLSRSRRGLSGVEGSMKALVLQGKEPVVTPHTFPLASTGIVEQMVEGSPEGFATTGYSSARKRKIKMLMLDGIAPNRRTITDGAYPLKRPLYLLVPRNPKPATRQFLDFVLSKEGQRLIDTLGVVPLRAVR